jgi:hypothetical protein
VARAETITKLSLDEWARYIGVHPLHFNGVKQPSEDPGRSPICNRPWFQYPWQDVDKIGREDIATAIAEAEAQVEEMLGYHLMPTWDYDEWRPTARYNRPELVVLNTEDVRGYARIITLNNAYFISGGIEATTLLGVSAVVYTDTDADNYKETATVTLGPTASVSDPSEIEIHLPSTAMQGLYDEKNRIRPITVHKVDNGNGTYTFTITCRREQLVLTKFLEQLPPLTAVDGGDDANFAATVDVWRHYNDPSTQATMLWENTQVCATCSGTGCPSCVYASQTACLIARGDPKMSVVAYTPVTWDAATSSFLSASMPVGRDADVIRAFYRSGWANLRASMSTRYADKYSNQVMDPHWARVIAQFAAAKLDRPVCDCGYAAAQLAMWNADLAYAGGAEQLSLYNLSQVDLDNPFGTKRGAVMAWKAIQSPAVGRAVLV